MLKRINWKAIGKGFAWVLCLSGIVVLMSFIEIKKQEQKCTKVVILIPGADNFIEREEVDLILKQSQGNLVGRNLSGINTHDIEKSMKANPYIAFAKVYADMDGVINVQIKQREPVLRILNAGGQDYYVDSEGLKMPISTNFTANVLVASGNILEGFGGRVDTLITPLVRDLYKAAVFIKRDTLWDAQFEQIYVNQHNDLELVPRVGDQRVILGNADSIAVKMENLLAFYKQAMPKYGWDTYRTINIKYTNQVICERKDGSNLTPAKVSQPVDSAVRAKNEVQQVIKAAINEEIARQATELAAKEKKVAEPVKSSATKTDVKKVPVENKPVGTAKASGPEIKKAETTPKAKPTATTKEKTDTKKQNR